jgi:hypothetical protein
MVIVIATRVDLRDESVMADEVFALSPISARAVQPSEADYDAIREAFMETSRGRWFLGEYAKRNRNADTRMVLDAVSRIEGTLAAHRQPTTPDDRLAEALAAIRGAVEQAARAATSAVDGAALESHLAPIRKGTRIIKEISWRWREIGADGRICDLIDSQLDAIDAGCGEIAELERRAAVTAAFDLIKTSIDGYVDGADTAPPAADDPAMAAPPPPADRMAQPSEAHGDEASDVAEPIEPKKQAPQAHATDRAEAAITEAVEQASAEVALTDVALTVAVLAEADLTGKVLAEVALAEKTLAEKTLAEEFLTEKASTEKAPIEEDVVDELIDTTQMPAETVAPAELETAELETAELETVEVEAAELEAAELAAEAADDLPDVQADAHDEAVLQLVAAEMAVTEPVDLDDHEGPVDDDIVITMRSVEAVSLATMPVPVAAPVRPPIVQPFPQSSPPVSFQPAPTIAREPSPEPSIEPSLGATIIANGLLQPAKVPANDPLAPIRRMSQAEKIAFFS